METIDAIALMLGAAWASGINLYAAVLVLGYMGATGYTTLPPALEVLQDPLVMGIAALMYFVEFVADKTPGVDSGWDAIHTFIRIPAGAMIAAGAAGGLDMNQAAEFGALLLGGSVAATSHFTKAGSRLVINTSPEPVTNWTASVAEDLAVVGGLWTALNYPLLFIAALILFMLLAIWLLPKIWRAIKRIAAKVRSWFSDKPAPEPESAPSNEEIARRLESKSADEP
ncbi:DUF4126 domain-containing protein [Solemya elarraichensis gill symbiont]|uniref:DUF4126 domain-containing protein n=1 Tax=Solemya elarraichensis gill symbiont TaxID=1918949 RepID=A0A1T2LCN5_9GAMM|nr:DUF4126 domain-containing protein [Solemya elarraichensis gill symbiont]OOZ42877.1 hypothetical protein BOW52_01185 [Solemya elarraichensis gill symbiont]